MSAILSFVLGLLPTLLLEGDESGDLLLEGDASGSLRLEGDEQGY